MSLKNKEAQKKYQREYMKNWRKENPDKEKELQRKSNAKRDYQKWYREKKKNDPAFIKKRQEYYQANKEYFKNKSKESYLRTRDVVRERWRLKRLKVLTHYGMKCQCCGEAQLEFLAVDHINNDGCLHRKTTKLNIYDWIIKNNFPRGFQILCHNCNMAKGFYGYCPHAKKKHT